jgi:hypothetical protein
MLATVGPEGPEERDVSRGPNQDVGDVTPDPNEDERPVKGGRAAERLRQFLAERFGDEAPPIPPDEEEQRDEAPPEPPDHVAGRDS